MTSKGPVNRLDAGGQPPQRVRATVWGYDAAAEKAALAHLDALEWAGAVAFEVAEVCYVAPGWPCPIDLQHPSAVHRKVGPTWVWALTPAGVPAGMVADEQRVTIRPHATAVEGL